MVYDPTGHIKDLRTSVRIQRNRVEKRTAVALEEYNLGELLGFADDSAVAGKDAIELYALECILDAFEKNTESALNTAHALVKIQNRHIPSDIFNSHLKYILKHLSE